MNSLQIEYFMAVARNSSFSRAAEELYVSQPTISRQVSILENELGFTLFDRTTRVTQLTEAGRVFHDYFAGCISGMQEAVDKARSANDSWSGSVQLGCLSGWNVSSFFPKILQIFSTEYPGIQLSMESRGFKSLLHALNNKQVDAIITVDAALKDSPAIQKAELTKVPRLILYPASHPAAQKEDPQPIDFKDDVFLVLSDDEVFNVAEYVRSYCEPHGFEPRIIRRVPNNEAMYDGVQNGLGVAIGDYWARDLTNSRVHFVPLGSDHTISVAWLKNNKNPALHVLINELMFIFDREHKQKAL